MTHQNRIRVLLVDDSPVTLAILKKLLSTSLEIDVVGTAKNGEEALRLISALDPAVICTDLEMPVMDGLALTKAIMGGRPKPILVVSSFVQKENAGNVFRVLEAGAIDVLPKPRGGIHEDGQMSADELVAKIKVLSGVIPIRRRVGAVKILTPPAARETATGKLIRIVVVGASTGGPQALAAVLGPLPATFPVPILCVQHIGSGFLHGLVDWLGDNSRLKVKIAQPGEIPRPGIIYFPRERTHLTIDRNGRLSSDSGPPVCGHCPSITVMFKSVVDYYRSATVGVLLTGMGEDGAEGLKAIANAGGPTIAQDEKTSIVFGMPGQAIAMGAARSVLPVDQIAQSLMAEVRLTK